MTLMVWIWTGNILDPEEAQQRTSRGLHCCVRSDIDLVEFSDKHVFVYILWHLVSLMTLAFCAGTS